MAAITTRQTAGLGATVKNSALTNQEVDNNFRNINSEVFIDNHPTVLPSLTLDFINSGVINPAITFTRNTTATRYNSKGVLESVGNNIPRLDYNPATLALNGLLVEESRINRLIRSTDFRSHTLTVTITGGTFQNGETVTATGGGTGLYSSSGSTTTSFNIYRGSGTFSGTLTGGTSGATATISVATGAWSYNSLTPQAPTFNARVAPDGSSAILLQPFGTGTLVRNIRQTYTTAVTGTWTFSIYVLPESITNNQLALVIRDQAAVHVAWANFNTSTLATPTVSFAGGSWNVGVASIQSINNNWLRLSLTVTTNTVYTSLNPELYLGGYQGTTETIGSVAVWGAQLEQGECATSYIYTTGSEVTRNADVPIISPISSWYNSTQGTLYAEAVTQVPSNFLSGALQPHVALINDQTLNNRIGMFYNTGGILDPRIVSGGTAANPANISAGLPSSSKSAIAFSIGTNGGGFIVNGSVVTESTPTAAPVVNRLHIGCNHVEGGQINGWVERIMYYPQRLTNQQLGKITI